VIFCTTGRRTRPTSRSSSRNRRTKASNRIRFSKPFYGLQTLSLRFKLKVGRAAGFEPEIL
jgi:hypothetical protein